MGGATAGDVGATSVLAILMLAQTGQKTSARPAGFLDGAEDDASPEEFPMSAAIAKLPEPADVLTRCTWPKVNNNWQLNAKSASHTTPHRFDLNQPIRHGPSSVFRTPVDKVAVQCRRPMSQGRHVNRLSRLGDGAKPGTTMIHGRP